MIDLLSHRDGKQHCRIWHRHVSNKVNIVFCCPPLDICA